MRNRAILAYRPAASPLRIRESNLMAQSPARRFRAIATLLALSVLTACGVQFAPNYDRTLIDGLARANEETMTLFATVAPGVTRSSFSRSRQKTYDELIGKFDALRLQASVRPAPRGLPPVFARGADGDATRAPPPPTEQILIEIIKTISAMRDTDKRQGLSPSLVVGFKRSFEISMHQVLTYEKALER